MKRSRSMWVRKVFPDGDKVDFEAASPVRDSFDTHLSAKEPISERERLMNVKRAKKMTQYFGDQPPTALFQITNFSQGVSENGEHRLRRDSLATIISISSSISVAHLDGRAVRDSYMSMSSVISTSSPASTPGDSVTGVTTTTDVIVDASAPHQDDGTASIDGEQGEDVLSKAQYEFPLPPASPLATTRSIRGLSPPPRSSPAGSTLVSVYHAPSTPRTPPPFSDFFDLVTPPPRTSSAKHVINGSSTSVVNEVPDSKISVEFHTRQKRAAKLSKFFGVEMNTFADVLPANPRQSTPVDTTHHSQSSPPRKGDKRVVSSDGAVPSVTVMESIIKSDPASRVEVSAEPGKGPLRFLHGQNARELDMNDAIDKLRRMKSV